MATAAELVERRAEWAEDDWTLKKVADLMFKGGYSQLPVRSHDRSVGRVTEQMICSRLQREPEETLARLTVAELPPGKAFDVVSPDTNERRILVMLEHEEAVLVRHETDKRVGSFGIITRANFVYRLRSAQTPTRLGDQAPRTKSRDQ